LKGHFRVNTKAVDHIVSKVPAVTLGFWIVKILATTLGETGGDAVSMTWLGETTPLAGSAGFNGYLLGTAIFLPALALLVWFQIKAKHYNPWLYWSAIVASTTAGTTMADFATRSMGIGYPGGSILLFALVLISLFVWHRSQGTISVERIITAKAEAFYWGTITFSQTLGTALGDWTVDDPRLGGFIGRIMGGWSVEHGGLGYFGGALLFGGILFALALLAHFTKINRVGLFWAAFILTRPLGATVGDFLDNPLAKGGLDFSRPVATGLLLVVIIVLIILLPQRAGSHPSNEKGN
jgi:uncharacterized membrane-anchored protein